MDTDRPTIYMTAAEASGDHHAAALITALKRRLPSARFIGAAGPKMAAAGCEVVLDLTSRASMVLGPLANLRYYRRAVRTLQKSIRREQPDILVPPGDSGALGSAISELLGDPLRAAEMGRMGLTLATDKHDIEKVVRKLERIMDRLLDVSHGRVRGA